MADQKVKCIFCQCSFSPSVIDQHSKTCTLNKANLKKIINFVVAFITAKASYRRQFPLPSDQSIEAFCRRERIEPFATFRSRVCSGMDIEAIIDLLFYIALSSGSVAKNDVPLHIKYLFDATQYLTPSEFDRASRSFNAIEAQLHERMSKDEIRSSGYRSAMEPYSGDSDVAPRRQAWRRVQ